MVVESRFSATFCDVPAFRRVEPAIGSAPVCSRMGWWAAARSGAPVLLATAMVSAPACGCQAQAGERVGRGAAGRDGDQHVVGGGGECGHVVGRLVRAVLGVFHRLGQGCGAAGDEQGQAGWGPVEGGGQFGAVLHADAAGCAGAAIDQPAGAVAQAGGGFVRGGGQGGQGRADGGDGGELRFEQGIQRHRGGPFGEVQVARVRAFCGWQVRHRRLPRCGRFPG